jgi:cell division protein FtsQ
MARDKQYSSRSETVRSRRSQSQWKTAATVHGRSRREEEKRTMPPVLVRGTGTVPSQPKRKIGRGFSSKPRRRFDVALASPGVEVRLPALPNVRVGWRLLSFVLVAGLVFVLYHLWTSPAYQAQAAELVGASRITAEEINLALNIVNKPIFSLDPLQLEQVLLDRYPELLEISVQVGLPASVVVSVIERVPIIEWRQDGVVRWIDGNGVIFDARGDVGSLIVVEAYASPPAHLIIEEQNPEDEASAETSDQVTGEETLLMETRSTPHQFISPEMVAAILAMRLQAPAESPLVYDPQHGLGWTDKRGWEAYFGIDVSEIEMKLNVYHTIAKQLRQDGIHPAMISVEFLHAPFYRLER